MDPEEESAKMPKPPRGPGWRLHLISLKLRGQSPEIPWLEIILLALVPWRLVQRWHKAERHISPSSDRVRMVRRDGAYVLWESPLGPFWARYTDGFWIAFNFKEVVEDRVYDLDLVSVRAGDVVIDAGAHLGMFTRFALSRGAQKVVAFEADSITLQYFRRTFADEIESGRVQVVNAAVWRANETLRFVHDPEHPGISRLSAEGSTEVQAVKIDDALATLGIEHVDFIKMDIEGAERHALAGAARTIQRSRPRMTICSYHLLDDVQVLPEVVFGILPEHKVLRRRDHDYYYCA
jgi:FkbM family methyltransferase